MNHRKFSLQRRLYHAYVANFYRDGYWNSTDPEFYLSWIHLLRQAQVVKVTKFYYRALFVSGSDLELLSKALAVLWWLNISEMHIFYPWNMMRNLKAGKIGYQLL